MKIKKKFWTLAAAVIGTGAVLGGAEFGFGTAERKRAAEREQQLRDHREKVVKTTAYKTRFGKTKYRHTEVTVNGFGEEVNEE